VVDVLDTIHKLLLELMESKISEVAFLTPEMYG